MLCFFYGADTYSSSQKLHQEQARFAAKNQNAALDIINLEGDKLSPDQWHQATQAAGFWGVNQSITIRRVLQLGSAEILETILADLPKLAASDKQFVMFWEDSGEFKKGPALPVFQFLKVKKDQQKYVYEFKALDEIRAVEWLLAAARERGGELEKVAGIKLVNMVGTDLWALSNELDKLLAYSNGEPIGVKAVQALVIGKTDENIFHLLDAILARNQAQALKLLHTDLNNGLQPIQFISMIIGQFRMLLVLKERSNNDKFLNSRAIADEYKWHPYVVQKNLAWLRQYSLERLKEIYRRLEDLDVLLKTTSRTEARLELFIAELLQ